jgi:hypothetical protein
MATTIQAVNDGRTDTHRARLAKRVLLLTTRLVLAGVFLSSALAKIREPYDFLSSIYGYRLVGPHTGFLIALILPPMEFTVAVALVGGLFLRGAFTLSLCLFSMFLTAKVTVLSRGMIIPCGCGTDLTPTINYTDLAGTIGLLAVASIGLGTLICGRSDLN